MLFDDKYVLKLLLLLKFSLFLLFIFTYNGSRFFFLDYLQWKSFCLLLATYFLVSGCFIGSLISVEVILLWTCPFAHSMECDVTSPLGSYK